MNCPSCGHENREGAQFCGECAAPLAQERPCSACGRLNPAGQKFCDGCAQPLVAKNERDPRDYTPKHLGEAAADDAERRQLTVMFCDLVGSTELSERLDAEELRELVRAYQQTAAESIERYEGHVAQYLGDGLLVYFGYPRAHEDDAVRGVTASLAILDALPGLNERLRAQYSRLGDVGLEVRIGVHTGPVVIGEMGGGVTRERLALGDTVNLASRLQAVASPGQAVMSEETRALVRGVFVTEHVGERTLKGIGAPVAVHRVVRATGVRSRLELAGATGLTPLVGREKEVALLLDRWEQVSEGHGQVVLLSGDPGIGKSRLVQILHERLAEEPHTWLEARASAYHENSALYPVIELLEQALLLADEDSAKEKIAKLEAALERAGFSAPEVLPLFAALLSVPLPERDPPLQLSPQAQRQRTLESLVAWLFSLTGTQPLVLVVEDLHWIDPSTLELLGMLVEQVPAVPVLLLLTFRPDFEPPWASRSHLVHLLLQPLSDKEIEAMVERIAGGKGLPAKVLEQLVTRTDGVPLFVEELTKTVLESDLLRESDRSYERTDPLPELAVPSTLQDSLMARLDRLGPAKEVAQVAAVIGREFPRELLEAVSPLDPDSLERALRELARAELLYPQGSPPRVGYSFKHALIQDTAYESLLRSVRGRLHGRIAEALEEGFPQRAAAEPELLAYHLTEAGDAERAVSYWQRAGERANVQVANAEAMRHLQRGLALIDRLDAGTERDQRELGLQVALGHALMTARGWAHPDTQAVWERARGLFDPSSDPQQAAAVYFGLTSDRLSRGDPRGALEYATELIQIAEGAGERVQIVGEMQAAQSLWYLGQFRESRDRLERVNSSPASSEIGRLITGMVVEGAVGAQNYRAWVEWGLGFPDSAWQIAMEELECSRRMGQPFRLGGALAWAGVLAAAFLRDEAQGESLGAEAERLGADYSFPLFEAIGALVRVFSTAGERDDASAADDYAAAMGRAAGTGNQAAAPLILGELAKLQLRAGRTEAAAGSVEGALAIAGQTGQSFHDVELQRQKGEILLRLPEPDEADAEALFLKAIEIARVQEAKSLELRAATSLARLRQTQGRTVEARACLAPIYDWFTEGFDTRDLKDAKALLEELA